MTRKCRECGGAVETRTATRSYDESGLKGIVLVGIPVKKCVACEKEEFGIPRMEELHRLIAMKLIDKQAALTGAEVRFLRKHLGYSAQDFAGRIDITPEHLSRVENDATTLSAMAERLVRLMVAHNDRANDYSLDTLAQLPSAKAAPLRLEVRNDSKGWRSAA